MSRRTSTNVIKKLLKRAKTVIKWLKTFIIEYLWLFQKGHRIFITEDHYRKGAFKATEQYNMNQIYFEAKGKALLDIIGMSKSEFARKMGIRKQNVKVLFKSKNLETIYKAATVMGVPFELLVGYIKEPDLSEIPIDPTAEDDEISAEDIPTGDTPDDKRARHKLILSFYHQWKRRNPGAKRYNISLKDDINIKNVSLVETAGHASLTYLSTLAVLQLDAILTNSIFIEKVPANQNKTNQNQFESMLRMEYQCVGIGLIKLLVGVKRSNKTKVQYCITVIKADQKGRPRRVSR